MRCHVFDSVEVSHTDVLCAHKQTLAELKRLIAYYEKETGEPQKFFALGLSSRRKMCINADVCHGFPHFLASCRVLL